MNICANCGNELIWLADGTLEGNQLEPLKNRKRARSNGVKKIPVKDIIIGAMFFILSVSILYKDIEISKSPDIAIAVMQDNIQELNYVQGTIYRVIKKIGVFDKFYYYAAVFYEDDQTDGQMRIVPIMVADNKKEIIRSLDNMVYEYRYSGQTNTYFRGGYSVKDISDDIYETFERALSYKDSALGEFKEEYLADYVLKCEGDEEDFKERNIMSIFFIIISIYVLIKTIIWFVKKE